MREGDEVRVFDLINPETSFCYNPFAYVRDDKDVLKLNNNLIRNTTPKGAQRSDPFREISETALLQALMLYLLHEAPPEEQNFSMIMEMLGSAQVKEDDEEYQSPLDILFERLEMPFPIVVDPSYSVEELDKLEAFFAQFDVHIRLVRH